MKIVKYLRDSIWQFVSAIIAVIAILISLYLFYLQRDVRALQVVILANTSLVEVEESVASEIQIFYEDSPIANLSLIQVKLENTGNISIREEDYSQPIQLIFPPQTKIIEAVILEANPQNIGLTIQTNKNSATFSKNLFNPGDRVIIRLLVTDLSVNYTSQPFKIDARIAEVTSIPIVNAIEQSEITSNLSVNTIIAAIGIVIALLSLALTVFRGLPRSKILSSRGQNDSSKFLFVPLDQIVNNNLESNYSSPPTGDLKFDEIPFRIKRGEKSILNISPLHVDNEKLELDKPVKGVSSAYFLTNAGNGFKENEGKTIGEIEFRFEDEIYQRQELVLGQNIREWAPGNIPGGLVDSVTDTASQQIWEGKNVDGNRAVIDRLEVLIDTKNQKRSLRGIRFSRNSSIEKSAFFVLAVTLKGNLY